MKNLIILITLITLSLSAYTQTYTQDSVFNQNTLGLFPVDSIIVQDSIISFVFVDGIEERIYTVNPTKPLESTYMYIVRGANDEFDNDFFIKWDDNTKTGFSVMYNDIKSFAHYTVK